jgi:AcrR family transcriptional regulator
VLERYRMSAKSIESEGPTTRQRILREASVIFAQKGYHGTSTREIAAAVGIQQPSLFHHFESKDAIMSELIDFGLDEPLAVAEREAGAEGSPASRLYRYLVWDVEYLCRSPYDLSPVQLVLSDPAFAGVVERYGRLVEARESLIRAAVAAGEFIDVDPTFAQQAIVWMIRGTIADVRKKTVEQAHETAERLASFSIRALLRDTDQLDEVKEDARLN